MRLIDADDILERLNKEVAYTYTEDYALRFAKALFTKAKTSTESEIKTKTIDEIISTLAKNDDTILSDKQYYEILKLKGGAENE